LVSRWRDRSAGLMILSLLLGLVSLVSVVDISSTLSTYQISTTTESVTETVTFTNNITVTLTYETTTNRTYTSMTTTNSTCTTVVTATTTYVFTSGITTSIETLSSTIIKMATETQTSTTTTTSTSTVTKSVVRIWSDVWTMFVIVTAFGGFGLGCVMGHRVTKSVELWVAIFGIPATLITTFGAASAYFGLDCLLLGVMLAMSFACAAVIGYFVSRWHEGRRLGSNVAFV